MSIGIKQAIDEFLLSCKVEGKSYGTDYYKGFRSNTRDAE
jgi:hypothetical protein